MKQVLNKDHYFLHWAGRLFAPSTHFNDLVSSCHIGAWRQCERHLFRMSLGCLLINWWGCFDWCETTLQLSPGGECVALRCICLLWPVNIGDENGDGTCFLTWKYRALPVNLWSSICSHFCFSQSLAKSQF